MPRTLRLAFAILVTVALSLGALGQLASASSTVSPADKPCGMSDSTAKSVDSKPMAPCKGMNAGCIDQMGCVSIPAVPAQSLTHKSVTLYVAVEYWTQASKLDSLDFVPDLLPPRSI